MSHLVLELLLHLPDPDPCLHVYRHVLPGPRLHGLLRRPVLRGGAPQHLAQDGSSVSGVIADNFLLLQTIYLRLKSILELAL